MEVSFAQVIGALVFSTVTTIARFACNSHLCGNRKRDTFLLPLLRLRCQCSLTAATSALPVLNRTPFPFEVPRFEAPRVKPQSTRRKPPRPALLVGGLRLLHGRLRARRSPAQGVAPWQLRFLRPLIARKEFGELVRVYERSNSGKLALRCPPSTVSM